MSYLRPPHPLALVTVAAAAAAATAALASSSSPASYYVSSSNPLASDANPGTSPLAPWQSLGRAARQSLQAGDAVSLLWGDVFPLYGDANVTFSGLRGTASSPITFGAYSDASDPIAVRPLIAKAPLGAGPAIVFDNCTGIAVTAWEINGGEQALAFTFDVDPSLPLPTIFSGFNVTDVQISDVHGLHPDPLAASWWGVAVAFAARHAGVVVTDVLLDRLAVSDSDTMYINDIQTATGEFTRPYVSGLVLSRTSMARMNFNTVFLDTTAFVSVTRNVFYKDIPASLFYAGTTDIILGSTNSSVSITGNEIGWRGEYEPGGPDGCAIDFETAADGTVVSGNYIHNSWGAGIMVLGHETTSTNLVISGNTMLANGCGSQRSDQGGIAFMHVNQSGVIKDNVFTTCPQNIPPLFNEVTKGALNGWVIGPNVVDGSGGATVVVMPDPVLTWSAFNGTFVVVGQCAACPPGAVLRGSQVGPPTLSDADGSFAWPTMPPFNGSLVLPPTGRGVWLKAFPPPAAVAAAPAGTVYVESAAVGDVLRWSRG